MSGDSVQMQMVRRYARILREQQADQRGPRIGARERRTARETAHAVTEAVGDAAQRALDAVKSPGSPAT
ncbi:MAG: hypothetical protein ACJ762_01545 [Solirubrobacteraceae bacterium]